MHKPLVARSLILLTVFSVPMAWGQAKDAKPAPKAEAAPDPIMQQASRLEGELGKLKDTAPEAGELMLKLVDLYHEHARVFGLIRVGQRFVSNHLTHARHAEAMLKYLDGLEAASRNKDTVANCRQFLLRYPTHAACAATEERLARTLDMMTDRAAAGDANAIVWRRQPATELGRRSLTRAITQYGEAGSGPTFTKAAEMAEAALDQYPAGDFAAGVGGQAVYYWERLGQYAKSNQAALKLIAKGMPQDREALRLLHMTMGENYARVGQRMNSADSFAKARAIKDGSYLLNRQSIELYNAGVKAPQLEPLITEFFQKHPQNADRFALRSHLALVHIRDGQRDAGLAVVRELLPHDARSNSLGGYYVQQIPQEPAQFAAAEPVLLDAVNRNPKDASYLRYVLAFELYRDRIKDLVKARQMCRDLIVKSPSNDSYTQSAIHWLLFNPASDAEFAADLDRIVEVRKQYAFWDGLRAYLPQWIEQAKTTKGSEERSKLAQQKLTASEADGFIADWIAIESPGTPKYEPAVQRLLVLFTKLTDEQAKSFVNRVAYYYLHYGSTEQRARSVGLYAQLAQRFPKDYGTAYYYLYSATGYGNEDQNKQAVAHVLSIEPQAYDSNYEIWYRIAMGAARVKDAELMKRGYAWIRRCQDGFGNDVRYADSIGDYLTQLGLKTEAADCWRRQMALDYNNWYSRSSAGRIFATLEGPARLAFMQQMMAVPKGDYHGVYAMWLAEHYLLAGDLPNFRKTLLDSQVLQRQRPFRTWGIEEYPVSQWIAKYRAEDPKITQEDRRQVYTLIRDLDMGRPSASAQTALLELPLPVNEKRTEMERLLAYQRTTTLLWYAATDWDWLVGYAQGAMARRDYAAVAALVSGMLENMRDAGPDRQKAGREMVAQSYARMGAVGLAIDETSPIAPLMQAALYLRLGDRRLAFDTYAANKALFDKHRDELPVDLIAFVCESHMAAGGEENHERVESILRGWLVKFSEAKDLDDATKAGVQLLLAKNYFKAQRFDVARSEYETVKNRYTETPSAIEAEFGIGETYLAQKDYSKAETVFDGLSHSRDRDVVIRAQFLRGVLYSRKGDREDARKVFRGVLDMVPNIDVANETLYHLSEVYGAEERYMDQLELLRTVGRLGRRSKRWHTPGAALSIVVYDPDLGTSRQHGRIPVKITTVPGGDEETLFLYTTPGGGKGLFRADLETRLGQAAKGDKLLQITGRDTIHVDYPQEFKAEFKSVPLSDAEIRIAANAKLEASSGKIIDPEKETLSDRLAREERETDPTQRRLSAGRPTNQIKPGNMVYLRVQDPDRDMSHDADRLPVKLTAASGDQVRVELVETGPHTGVFEGQAQTGELPAGALASDTGIDHSPLMAIDQDPATYWLSQPDGATPKWLTVDMKDLKSVNHVTFTSPNPKSQAPVRGTLQGSHDGRFWFRIGSIPPQPPVPAVATEFGRMKLRVYQGDYTSYSNWQQVVDLAKAVKPQVEKDVDTLAWSVPETDETAKLARAVLWHGKFYQERSRGVRFSVSAYTSAIVVDGQLELPLAAGDGRTVDVWLDRGTHELTIFATTANPVQGISALRAIEDPNTAQVVLAPFRLADFDLAQPAAKPAVPRKPVLATSDNGVWDFQFAPYELRHVKLLVQEYTGEALAISQVKVSGEEDGQIIPTKADILKLAGNNILEIASGDVITAAYTDEFTQNSDGASQLLTTQLQATYFNAYITPIIYDLVRQQDGAVAEVRKQLIRIDPGEKFILEVVDYDHDTSPEPDQLKIRVALNDGAPQELVAQETGPGTGIFVKEVFTADKADGDKLVVKQGDRIYCTYLDTQNTFPGHAVARETVVFVNEPAEGKVRIVETRFIRGEENPQSPGQSTPPRVVYLPADPAVQTAKVAFEVPLTIEVYDRDAAKDSSSKVIVQLTTTDGAKVDVECIVSPQFAQATIAPTVGAETWALEEGRFVGQIILQLGSKGSPALVPLSSEMPRDLVGGPSLTEEERGKGVALVTRVLNLTGKDVISAVYKDLRRPGGAAQDLLSRGRLIANATLACTDREYDRKVQKLHVGEKMYLRVVDADLDSSDERDVAVVTITTPRGEKETLQLLETLAHSGVFTGSVTLRPSEKPTAGNLKVDDPAIEAFFGDTLALEYLDKAASTESGELRLKHELPIVIGTDGLVAAFSKTFHDEKLAVETQFHIAESYFELFKSHRKLGRKTEERDDLEHGRRVLREVMEDYPNPVYAPRIAYLLGQFAQELKQYQEAIEAYRMIVRRHPDHALAADAQFKLAQCYEESKEFNQALEEYVTLAATYPKSPLIANVMVRIMDHFYNNIDKGDNYEVAAQVGRKFLEKFEGHEWAPKVAFRIGQAYYKSKKFAEAGKAFDDFAKVFPDNALSGDAVFWSGESFWQGKNNAEAYKRYQMCRWKYPSSEAAKFALGRLSLPEMIAQLEADAQSLDNNNN